MNYRYILYTIINFFLWLGELLRVTLNIILLPLQILLILIRDPYSDFVPAVRRIVHLRFHDLRNHAEFLRITIFEGKVSVYFNTYEEELEKTQNEMNTAPYKSLKQCFDETLKKAMNYSFIIYEVNESGLYFFQYAVADGEYTFDFPLTKLGLNRDCSREVIALLSAQGFEKSVSEGYPTRKNTYSIISLSEEMSTISANCGTDRTRAVSLSTGIYTHIFKKRTYPQIKLL